MVVDSAQQRVTGRFRATSVYIHDNRYLDSTRYYRDSTPLIVEGQVMEERTNVQNVVRFDFYFGSAWETKFRAAPPFYLPGLIPATSFYCLRRPTTRWMASNPGQQPICDRADVHKSCKSLETLLGVLSDYCEAAEAVVILQKKLAKALRESAGLKITTDIAG